MTSVSADQSADDQLVVIIPPGDATNDETLVKIVDKKQRRKPSTKGKRDDGGHHCIQHCLHNGSEGGDMVQCHLCQLWIHPECVGEDNKNIVGIWSCKSCRVMPILVERLS